MFSVYGDYKEVLRTFIVMQEKSDEDEIPIYDISKVEREFLGSLGVFRQLRILNAEVKLFSGRKIGDSKNIHLFNADFPVVENLFITKNGSVLFHVRKSKRFEIDEREILKLLSSNFGDIGIIVDMNLGLCTPRIVNFIKRKAKETIARILAEDFEKYYNVDYIILNLPTFERIYKKRIKTETELFSSLIHFRNILKSNIVLTWGGKGCIYCGEGEILHVSALEKSVVNRFGVGDVFLATFAYFRKKDIAERLKLCNLACSISVGKTYPYVNIEEIEDSKHLLDKINVREYRL